jgi:hypothetical protein
MARGFLDEDRQGRGGDRVQRSDLVDVSARKVRDTPLAWCLNDGAREVWIPKAHSEWDGQTTFTMPGWLAREKGLI